MAEHEHILLTYRRGIRTSLRNNSSAYGYTIAVTASFGTLSHVVSPPSLLEIYLFVFGAVAAFAVLEAIVSKMFREKLRGEPSDVVALGSTFSIVSISAAIGVAWLATWLIDAWAAWPLGAFGATVAYLLFVGAEMTLAAQAQRQRRREHEKENSRS